MTDAMKKVLQMYDMMKRKAPVLCPTVIPDALKHSVSLDGLLDLVKNNIQAANLLKEIMFAAQSNMPDQKVEVVFNTELDFSNRIVNISEARLASPSEALLRNLDMYMEIQLQKNTTKRLEELEENFCEANGIKDGRGKLIIQEVYCIAYALRVASSNIQGWKLSILGQVISTLSEDDLASTFAELFKCIPTEPLRKEGKRVGKRKRYSRNK